MRKTGNRSFASGGRLSAAPVLEGSAYGSMQQQFEDVHYGASPNLRDACLFGTISIAGVVHSTCIVIIDNSLAGRPFKASCERVL